ncbi:hypothetical protein SRHO_G00262440 [Serrasalmus rhombeus]
MFSALRFSSLKVRGGHVTLVALTERNDLQRFWFTSCLKLCVDECFRAAEEKSEFSKAVASVGQSRSEDVTKLLQVYRCLTRAELVQGLFHAAVRQPPASVEKFHCVSDSQCRACPAGAASVMQLHSKGHCVLIVLIIVFSTGSASAVAPMKVKLHDSAALPCSGRCSGLVKWTEFSKPSDALAECDQTSCGSKEGYQMIHDQYLKGNLSLIITDTDFTKRVLYTCDCDGEDLCDVKLQIEVLDVQDSWTWKNAYEKGNSDGYEKGMRFGALAVGVAALVIMIGVFFLGVFAAPWVRPQMDSCVQMPRSNDSSYRSQCEEKERGRSLASNDVS